MAAEKPSFRLDEDTFRVLGGWAELCEFESSARYGNSSGGFTVSRSVATVQSPQDLELPRLEVHRIAVPDHEWDGNTSIIFYETPSASQGNTMAMACWYADFTKDGLLSSGSDNCPLPEAFAPLLGALALPLRPPAPNNIPEVWHQRLGEQAAAVIDIYERAEVIPGRSV